MFPPKDPVPQDHNANVIYSIPCSTCPASYIIFIRQTGRLLQTRLYEHECAVRKGEVEKSAVAEHVWREGYQIDFSTAAVLAWETECHQRCYLSRGSFKQSGLLIESWDDYLLCTRPFPCIFILKIVSAFPYLHCNFLLCVHYSVARE